MLDVPVGSRTRPGFFHVEGTCKGLIFRAEHNKDNPFVAISKESLCQLSLEERGFLTYLLEKPTDWHFRIDAMCKELGVHRSTVYRLFKKMMDLGYVTRHDIKGMSPTGLMRQVSLYDIYEIPIPTLQEKDVRLNGEEIPF